MGNMAGDTPRLIEQAFPLKQASLDSVHEKNVRHGHISTLHIWPARRPLAACRAALITALTVLAITYLSGFVIQSFAVRLPSPSSP